MRIHGSAEYRQNIENLEAWRRSRALTTSIDDEEPTP